MLNNMPEAMTKQKRYHGKTKEKWMEEFTVCPKQIVTTKRKTNRTHERNPERIKKLSGLEH